MGKRSSRKSSGAKPSASKSHASTPVDHASTDTSASSSSSSAAASKMKTTSMHSNGQLRSLIESWLLQDSNSPSSLLSMLKYQDLASLHATSNTWKKYLESSESHASVKPVVRIRSAGSLQQLMSSSWARHLVRGIKILTSMDHDCLRSAGMLKRLPLFTRLEMLEMQMPNKVSDGFMTAIGSLSGLRILHLLVDRKHITTRVSAQSLRSQSFASLRRLTKLTSLQMECEGFICTKQQMDDILQCKSLQTLGCGKWIGDHQAQFDSNRSRARWITDGVARLHQMPSLTNIKFSLNEDIGSDVWPHLSRCRSLRQLSPIFWDTRIGEEWSLLGNLSQLNTLIYAPSHDVIDLLPPSNHLWQAIVQAKSISNLTLNRLALNETLLGQLVSALPNLERLDLAGVAIQSLFPLAKAQKLTRLAVAVCQNFSGDALNVVNVLPDMPQLLEFVTWDPKRLDYSLHYMKVQMQQRLSSKLPNATITWV